MKLCYLGISCLDVDDAVNKFLTLYSFERYGCIEARDGSNSEVMRHGGIFVILKKAINSVVDSIDDIAFCVNSLHDICEKIAQFGSVIVQKPCAEDCNTYSSRCDPCKNCLNDSGDCLYSVEKAVIKSSVGNLKHTLIEKCEGFSGNFLPGFVRYPDWNEAVYGEAVKFNCIDHIALAVPCSETLNHISWYKNCLEMSKFNCNKLEKEDGLIIKARQGRGLKLFTLALHPCSERGVTTEEKEVGNNNINFVFCESLTEQGILLSI